MGAFPFIEGIDGAPAYRRDVGTIDAHWQAHMDLIASQVPFSLQRCHGGVARARASTKKG
jgi:ADP-glucose pyrophosphorylase